MLRGSVRKITASLSRLEPNEKLLAQDFLLHSAEARAGVLRISLESDGVRFLMLGARRRALRRLFTLRALGLSDSEKPAANAAQILARSRGRVGKEKANAIFFDSPKSVSFRVTIALWDEISFRQDRVILGRDPDALGFGTHAAGLRTAIGDCGLGINFAKFIKVYVSIR